MQQLIEETAAPVTTAAWAPPKAAPSPEFTAKRKAKKRASRATPGVEAAADAIVRLAAEECELWLDSDGNAAASWTSGGHRENALLRSRPFREMAGSLLYEDTGKGATSRNFEAAEATLAAMARAGGARHKTAIRVHATGTAITLDLGGEDWRAVRVTPDSVSIIPGQETTARFLRRQGLQAIPPPDLTAGTESLALLWKFVNVRESDRVLILGWLLQCLQPAAPYFGLNLFGAGGTAKTSSTTVLRRLMDPNSANTSVFPSDGKDLFIAAQGQHVLAFDNMSHLPGEQSDWLCRLSTGSGFRTRSLFTDFDETILVARNPWILNGIPNTVARGDLLERALSVELLPISQEGRKSEAELEEEFRIDAPKILGALLNAARHALAGIASTRKAMKGKLPRMADAAAWICAGETALGCKPGEFLREHERMIQSSRHDALDGDPIGRAIIALFERNYANDFSGWEAPLGKILDTVRMELDWSDKSRRSDPLRNAHAFSAHITRTAAILEGSAGIKVQRLEPRRNDGWHYRISRPQPQA